MKIGIDFNNVAHKFPEMVRVLAEGHDVYILSGIGKQRVPEVQVSN